jgi:hypothetical protein
MKTRSTRVLLPVAALGLALGLSACGEDDTAAPASSDEPVVVEVTFADGTVTPAGERVQVDVGQEVVFEITADEAGELHAHTTEELELAYPEGTSEQTMTVDQPGVVDVESHDLDQVVVQLQVS